MALIFMDYDKLPDVSCICYFLCFYSYHTMRCKTIYNIHPYHETFSETIVFSSEATL